MKTTLLSLALLAFPFLNAVSAESNEIMTEPAQFKIEEAMREKISTLGPGTSFAYVDLGITEEEFRLIDQLKFDPSGPFEKQYDCFGDLALLKMELPAFLRYIGNDDEDVVQAAANIIYRTADTVIKASNKDSAWICVRGFLPNQDFDMPRWHIDGHYFGPIINPPMVYKFAAVLKGKPTLLYNLPDEMRNLFWSNMQNRQFLSELLDLDQVESPKKGEGVFFVVTDKDIGAVHSEPKMDEPRLFFSILPGTASDIEELYLRWHPNKN